MIEALKLLPQQINTLIIRTPHRQKAQKIKKKENGDILLFPISGQA
jgi:hypothetical protein